MQRYDGATGAPGSRINVANGVERITLRGDILWVLTSGPDLLHRYDATIGTRLSSTGALQGLDPDTGDVRKIPVGKRPFSLVLAEDGIWVGDTAENNVRFVKP